MADAGPHHHRRPLCLTIIGIPFGIADSKLIPVSLFPLGREIVPTDQPFAARRGPPRP